MKKFCLRLLISGLVVVASVKASPAGTSKPQEAIYAQPYAHTSAARKEVATVQPVSQLRLQASPERSTGILGTAVRKVDKAITGAKVPDMKTNNTVDATTQNIKALEKYVSSKKTTFSRTTTLSKADVIALNDKITTVQKQIDALQVSDSVASNEAKIKNLSTLQDRLTRVIADLNIRSAKTAEANQKLVEKDSMKAQKKSEKAKNTVGRTVSVPVGLEKVPGKLLPKVKTRQRTLPGTSSFTSLGKTLSEVADYVDGKTNKVTINKMVDQFNEMRSLKDLNVIDAEKIKERAKSLEEKVDATISVLETNRTNAEQAIRDLRDDKIKTDANAKTILGKISAYANHRIVNVKLYNAKKTYYKAKERELAAKIIKENYRRQQENLSMLYQKNGQNRYGSWTIENPQLSLRTAKEFTTYQNIRTVKEDLNSVAKIEDATLRDALVENMARKVVDMSIASQGKYLVDGLFKDDFEMVQQLREMVDTTSLNNNPNAQYLVARISDGIVSRFNESKFSANSFATYKITKLDGGKIDMQLSEITATFKNMSSEIKYGLKNKPMQDVDKAEFKAEDQKNTKPVPTKNQPKEELVSEEEDEVENWDDVSIQDSIQYVKPIPTPRKPTTMTQSQDLQSQYDELYNKYNSLNDKTTQEAQVMSQQLRDMYSQLNNQSSSNA